jgi:hypothetical protein
MSARTASAAVVGATRKFWIDTPWREIPTTLRAASTYCNVWVADVNFNNSSSSSTDNIITSTQAQAIAAKFDDIYDLETPVFGYEYGGGPGGNGGVDEDDKIQILVYDIDRDYAADQTGGVLGFFWSKDEFAQSELDGYYGRDVYKSNQAEMFYVDAHFSDYSADTMASTLAHEYQHMINFNVKTLQRGEAPEVWYNEMLSMLAEDVIDPLIGIPVTDSSHPAKSRILYFLDGYYRSGPAEWRTDDFSWNILSYSNVYAFGAYLVRNFGGVEFLNAMSANDSVDVDSISTALASFSGKTGVTSFSQAISRYGEALVFNNTSGANFSFNKTTTGTISGQSYTFHGFDIFGMRRYDWSTGELNGSGPKILSTNVSVAIPPNGVVVFQDPRWKNTSATLTINLTKPTNPNVEFYLMEK